MASGNKLIQALQLILEDLSETNCPDADIEEIETENAQLRQKKIELMAKLNYNSSVNRSVVLVKDMLLRQKTQNQTRSELKEQAAIRYKERSREAAAQAASWKQKLQEIDNLMTLPHNEVFEKVIEMDKKIVANRLKINELIQEQAKLNRDLHGDDDILNLSETLKCIEEEQRNLLEKLQNETRDKRQNK